MGNVVKPALAGMKAYLPLQVQVAVTLALILTLTIHELTCAGTNPHQMRSIKLGLRLSAAPLILLYVLVATVRVAGVLGLA